MTGTPEKSRIRAADCELRAQGRRRGACGVEVQQRLRPACEATLRQRNGKLERLIESAHLSRPENYLSIYQSGCNFSCRKCHSWYFSQRASEEIPFTILAFFPQYRMKAFRAPNLHEMLAAHAAARAAGLKNVRLGNIGLFAKTQAEVQRVLEVNRPGHQTKGDCHI